MGWMQNFFSGGKQEMKELQQLDAALEYGHKVASSVDAEMEQLIAIRFGHIKTDYLNILNGNQEDAKKRMDHSPIIVARVDFDLFNENVANTREKMRVEILQQMAEWQKLFNQMGANDDIERLADSKLHAFVSYMQLAGIDKFMEHADELRMADDTWRAANPEQARQEPLS